MNERTVSDPTLTGQGCARSAQCIPFFAAVLFTVYRTLQGDHSCKDHELVLNVNCRQCSLSLIDEWSSRLPQTGRDCSSVSSENPR